MLSDVSFRINAGEKAGLIGPNGAGKTSIARLISGDTQVTGGTVTRAAGLRVGYVRQRVEHDEDATVIDSVLAAQRRALSDVHELEERLAHTSADDMQNALDAYEAARAAYARTGGDGLRARATAMLDALGLAGRNEQRVSALSGGEKNVLSLTQALLAEPDLLVLDEPGNHLDFAGIAWLERFLVQAFTRGDHREGTRAATLLEQHRARLDELYARWIAEEERG